MITLTLTPVQYDIVRTAVMEYTDNLMQIIDPPDTVSLSSGGTVTVTAPLQPTKKVEAPWGLKKDGTPKARPGRKVARKGRA